MATIGVDLTPIQGPHRMRGVGSTVINVLRHVASSDKSRHEFVFYLYETDANEALELIDAPSFPRYELRYVRPARPLPPNLKTVRGVASIPVRIKDMWIDRLLGTKRITDLEGIDAFLQFEQDVIMPSPKKVKSIVIAYDLIPYVLEGDYLWNYKTARNTHNYSRRGALKAQIKRNLYLSTIRLVMRRAHRVIAISGHTKQDFVKYVGISPMKISVCHLGIDAKKNAENLKPSSLQRYVETSWGDVKIISELPNEPFLLYIGGADPRRKLADLVHAFNLLRAQGHQCNLVLTGDTMLGPNSVPNIDTREALLNSSYLNDIYMLGFVDDSTREWLYQNALAFVYPSRYEGFGLPILEAMRYGTPVITYPGTSVSEIAGNAPLFANDPLQIAAAATNLMSDRKLADKCKKEGLKTSAQFSWNSTSKYIMDVCSNISN